MGRRDNLSGTLFPDAATPQIAPPPAVEAALVDAHLEQDLTEAEGDEPPLVTFSRPELNSAAYWSRELRRADASARKTECYRNMIASLTALDHTEA